MAIKPTSLPEWNSGGANNVEPNAGRKASGFTNLDQPTSAELNWWFKLVYAWTQWLDNGVLADIAAAAWTWAAAHIFNGAVTTNSTVVNNGAVTNNSTVTTNGTNNTSVNSASPGSTVANAGGGGGSRGTSAGAGAGVEGTNSSTGPGGKFSNSSTGPAIEVGAGNEKFTGPNPASTTGFSNTMTPANVIKAWGRVNSDNGTPVVEGGFNIASLAVDAVKLTVTFATPMANANYAVVCTQDSATSQGTAHTQTANGFEISWYDHSVQPPNLLAPNVNILLANFIVVGLQ